MYLSYFGVTGIQPADGIVGTRALSSDYDEYVPLQNLLRTIYIEATLDSRSAGRVSEDKLDSKNWYLEKITPEI
ncbi:unnamed protein product [Macrosiphum euphorbiae]|uniref:Uncharacterized protein n=1 Tax=Macrosiphum euphorbiae TaxID=13131 RepID=A0AAV0WW29_9HEMI|nr:unnamed protein product [Macrosiphum euphorbiae]